MKCGQQCVVLAGIKMLPQLCADNWGTASTQVKVSSHFWKKIDVTKGQMLPVYVSYFVMQGCFVKQC